MSNKSTERALTEPSAQTTDRSSGFRAAIDQRHVTKALIALPTRRRARRDGRTLFDAHGRAPDFPRAAGLSAQAHFGGAFT